jgi:hypothetical protein|tara:strand:- start:6590 stop:6841 length:252 start_codon:yes stop_codon:yes gene_type:complete
LEEPSFTGLFKDLALFFGCVIFFVLGFLAISYVLPPTRNGFWFWSGFLAYIYLFSRLLKWMMRRQTPVPDQEDGKGDRKRPGS